MEREDRLAAVKRLPPDAQEPVVGGKRQLRRVRVKAGLAGAQAQPPLHLGHHLRRGGRRVIEPRPQRRIVPAVAVDRPVHAAPRHRLVVVFRRGEGVEIEGRDPLERHHDGLRAQEARDPVALLAREGAPHRVEIAAVELVGRLAAARQRPHRHQPAIVAHAVDHRRDFLGRQDALDRAHADAVMARGEVEIGATQRRRRHRPQPAPQVPHRARQHRMQHQGRQRELIDHMRLVTPAEIAQVLGLGHVRLGQQDHRLGRVIRKQPHQLHDRMGLRHVDRGRARRLPQEGHRIEPDDPHAFVDMQPQDAQDLEQHLGVAEIEIDLIVAEGAPDMARPRRRRHRAQKRRGARPHHRAQIVPGRGLHEEAVIGRLALEIGGEPGTLRRDMVQHHVRHQAEGRADATDVGPVPKRGVDLAVIHHREAVVRTRREEGQHMNAVDHPGHLAPQEILQQIKRLVRAVLDRVAIGDDDRVAFRPQVVRGPARPLPARAPLGPEGGKHRAGKVPGIAGGIDLLQQPPEMGLQDGMSGGPVDRSGPPVVRAACAPSDPAPAPR
ncbi:hypothetical protein SDC9_46209 [bioreactor metagenome]|uniref:Uncharacterized protein n=1 Tax=bioreactor metagenome TaxID=1076179 RepID=A0A644W904_9ZZZZ